MASGSGYRVCLVELVVVECGWWDKSQLSVAPLEGVSSFTLRLHCRCRVFLLCTDHWSVEPENEARYALYGVPVHTSYSASVSGWALLASHLSPITLHSCILYTPSPCTSPSHVQEGMTSEELKYYLTREVCVLCVMLCM